MTDDTRQRTCEERIGEHMEGRLVDFRALTELAGYDDGDDLSAAARELLAEDSPTDGYPPGETDAEAIREWAEERMYEYPLGVSSQTVFRVELSTGGPGDWLEVTCSGNLPRYEAPAKGMEPYEVERITYHFNDWFDHAERELHGDDLAAAELFVSRVVPELAE